MAGRHRTAKSHANRVTLTISPALIKRGDSRGDDFSTEKVVCQSEVIRGHSTRQYIHKHIASAFKLGGISRLAKWMMSVFQPKGQREHKSGEGIVRRWSTGLMGRKGTSNGKKEEEGEVQLVNT